MLKLSSRIFIHSLLFVGVSWALLSCKQVLSDFYPSEGTGTEHAADSHKLQPVRIVAEVLRDPASTRANGTYTGTDLGEFNPLFLADHDYERRIYAAALYVLRDVSTEASRKQYEVVKRILYVTPEFKKSDLHRAQYIYDDASGWQYAEGYFDEIYTLGDASGKFVLNSDGYMELGLELVPGNYTVLMSANGGSFDLAKNAFFFGTPTPDSPLTIDIGLSNNIFSLSATGYHSMLPNLESGSFAPDYVSAFTTRDYKPQADKGISNYLIPMSGYAHITVLAGKGVSDSGDPVQHPTVDTDGNTPFDGSGDAQVAHVMLERVQARIDVTLTTADSDLKDYIHSYGTDTAAKYRPEDWMLNKMLFWVPRGTGISSSFFPAPFEYSFYSQKYPDEDVFVNVTEHTRADEKSAVAFLAKRPMWGIELEEHLVDYYDEVGRTYAYKVGSSKETHTESLAQIAMTPEQMVSAGINLPDGGLAKMYKRSLILDSTDEGKSYQEASIYVPTQLTLPLTSRYEYLFLPQNSPLWPDGYFDRPGDISGLRKQVVDAYTELFLHGKFSMSEMMDSEGFTPFNRQESHNSSWGLKYPLTDAVSSISFIALEFARVGADRARLESDAAYRDANVLTYMIPIVNGSSLDVGKFRAEPEQFFSLRRNTVYQFDLTFTGRELKVTTADITYSVEPWKERPVELPVFD